MELRDGSVVKNTLHSSIKLKFSHCCEHCFHMFTTPAPGRLTFSSGLHSYISTHTYMYHLIQMHLHSHTHTFPRYTPTHNRTQLQCWKWRQSFPVPSTLSKINTQRFLYEYKCSANNSDLELSSTYI